MSLPVTEGAVDDARLVLIDTFKGGTGKTTTARWLAESLAMRGARVLLTGLSPQNDVVSTDPTAIRGVRDVVGGEEMPSVVEVSDSLLYVPAGTAAFGVDDPGLGAYYRLLAVRFGCQWCLVDGINFLQDASWWVADEADALIVPAKPTPEAVQAGLRTMRAVLRAQSTLGRAKGLSLVRLLLVDVLPPSRQSAATKELIEALEAAYGAGLLASRIRHTARRQAGDDNGLLRHGLRTDLIGPRIAEDYAALAEEISVLLAGTAGV